MAADFYRKSGSLVNSNTSDITVPGAGTDIYKVKITMTSVVTGGSGGGVEAIVERFSGSVHMPQGAQFTAMIGSSPGSPMIIEGMYLGTEVIRLRSLLVTATASTTYYTVTMIKLPGVTLTDIV